MKRTFLTLFCLRPCAAWPRVPSDLPVRGGHVSGGGGPAGAARVAPDVAQPAAAQRPGGPHHLRPHGPGARAQLRGHRQELRLPRHQGTHPQTDPGEVTRSRSPGAQGQRGGVWKGWMDGTLRVLEGVGFQMDCVEKLCRTVEFGTAKPGERRG